MFLDTAIQKNRQHSQQQTTEPILARIRQERDSVQESQKSWDLQECRASASENEKPGKMHKPHTETGWLKTPLKLNTDQLHSFYHFCP